MATFTDNGALSYPANDPLLDLFYRALRNTPEDKMRAMVREAWQGFSEEETKVQRLRRLHTLKLLFHLRWCRGGKGERNMFRIAMNELVQFGAGEHVLANLENVPFFGYWKDLLFLLGTELEPDAVKMYATQLSTDRDNLNSGNKQLITLAGKWAPSEGKEFDRKHAAVRKFCSELGVNKAQYRKQYAAPLRKHIRIVETQLCSQEWDAVNYAHVPALARLKYAKTFRKHDEARYDLYMRDVAAGRAKMNIKLVFPYQLVEKYLSSGYTPDNSDKYPSDEDLDTMWNELVKQIRADLVASNANLQALGVADLSGSMHGVPMQNSVALSLLWSELCEGRFHGHFYTFSRSAKLLKIQGKTLRDKVTWIMQHAEIENTNFQAVFDDMLNHAGMWSLPPEMYPKTVYVFTDGQFDAMVTDGDKTHLDALADKHRLAGYEMPEIVFWNLRGDTVDFPSPGDRKGVAMLSGFSPSLMSLIMKGQELTPTGIMLQAIEDPALDRVVLAPLS